MTSVRSANENLSRAEAMQRSETVRAHRYTLHMDFMSALEDQPSHFAVTTTVRFTAEQGANTFLDYVGGIVDSITLNGRVVDPNLVVDGARVHLRGLEAQNTVTIESRSAYSRSGEGVHYFKDPTDQRVYIYSQNEPADCRRIYPCFDQPDQKATFRVSICAPTEWHVDTNGALESVEALGAEAARRHFSETKPMSTYITTFLAGPYATWQDHYEGVTTSGELVSIPLQLACRASIAQHLDTAELFDLTKRGLDWFHRNFDYPYPWGDYHQAFVPEYNLGAMENPGLVTFTESYVFTSAPTLAQHAARANTLMHEMTHMWFGDLVTMTWWDDLWLKESFADYVGTLVVDEATDFTTAWSTFASKRKGWAYIQDQYPTTHPIVADIPDLESADQNFDGITYAKGASVLKQLSAYVGREVFLEASRAYFREHAWGNTTLPDFLAALSCASGLDMGAWAEAWLTTAGVSSLWVQTQTNDADLVTDAILHQQGTDPMTGNEVVRPQTVEIGLFNTAQDGAPGSPSTCTKSLRVPLEAASAQIPELIGKPASDAVLPNHRDQTYAKVLLEHASLETALEVGFDTDLDRATALAAAWNMTRDSTLAAERFLSGVRTNAFLLEDMGTLSTVLNQAGMAARAYTRVQDRAEVVEQWLTFLASQVLAAPQGSDRRLVFSRSMLHVSARASSVPQHVTEVINAWLEDPHVLGEELAWAALIAQAAHGAVQLDELQRRYEAAPTHEAARGLRQANAARPDADAKAKIRAAVYSGSEPDGTVLSNDYLQAYLDGLGVDPQRVDQADPEEYWHRIGDVWARMSQGQATRIVRGLFPSDLELTEGDTKTHPQMRRARTWLHNHADAPRALRRVVIEHLDDAKRRLRAQASSRV